MMLARQPGRETQPGFTGIGRIKANGISFNHIAPLPPAGMSETATREVRRLFPDALRASRALSQKPVLSPGRPQVRI